MNYYQDKRKENLSAVGKIPLSSLILFIVVITFAVFTITFSIANALNMGKASRENAKDYVSELSTQIAETINTDQNDIKKMLSGISETIGILYSDGIEQTSTEEYLESFLNASNNSSQFDYLVFLNLDGNIIKIGDVPSSLENSFNNDHPIVNEAKISEEPVAYIEDDNILFANKVYSDNNLIGTLIGGLSTDDLKNLINVQIYRNESNFCITNNDGKLLVKSGATRFEELNKIAESLPNEMAELENGIRNKTSGVITIEFPDNETYLLAYAPVKGEDWVLLTLIPINLFSGIYTPFMNRAVLCSIGAAAIFVILLALLALAYKHARLKLEQIAFTDDITEGINNNEFQVKYHQLQRKENPLDYSIVMLDIRDFKLINESDGFAVGDKVLKHVYDSINDCLEEKNFEFVTRSEEDHFFICLKENTVANIQRRIDIIVAYLNKGNFSINREYRIEFEQGACLIDDKNIDISKLQERARIARKHSNKDNLNKCVIFTNDMQKDIIDNRILDRIADESIKNHDFLVYYQPKVSMATGEVKGAEALVRWNHPDKGLISPAQFIPVLEDSGRIQQLDKYVFEEVCKWLSEREKSGKYMFPISINLSRTHFWKDNFLKEYVEIADKYGVNHDYIEFEITETAFMGEEKHNKIKKGIEQMHKYGFRCSVDDFGVGYSSLSLVHEMDVDILKFDRSFFLNLSDEKSQKIVRSLINMANELQLGIIIEGIETQDQIDFLKKENCDVIQGYYYSKPLPEHEFDDWIETSNK